MMVKPDGVQRSLVGEIISRFEKRGLRIDALKMMQVSEDLASEHYAEHVGKDFYESLIQYIRSGPVVVMAVSGGSCVSVVRQIVGKTAPKEATPGTIRADYGLDIGRNIVHASDSPESAKRELNLFFKDSEYVDYRRIDEDWLYP